MKFHLQKVISLFPSGFSLTGKIVIKVEYVLKIN